MQRLEQLARPRGVPLGTGLPVIAALPQNALDYATAAEESGADAIVVSVDKTDNLLPALFADFEIQERSIVDFLSVISVPVGISIGDAKPLSREMWERITGMRFSFVNMFAHHMPLFVLEDERMEKLVSVGPGYMLEQVRSISNMEQVGAIEAALVSPQARAQQFNLLDLSTVRLIAELSSKPVFLRTQKRVRSEDLPIVRSSGVRGLTLDPSAVEPGVEPYGAAVKDLKSGPAVGHAGDQTTLIQAEGTV